MPILFINTNNNFYVLLLVKYFLFSFIKQLFILYRSYFLGFSSHIYFF